jgi:hypothetical protein
MWIFYKWKSKTSWCGVRTQRRFLFAETICAIMDFDWCSLGSKYQPPVTDQYRKNQTDYFYSFQGSPLFQEGFGFSILPR